MEDELSEIDRKLMNNPDPAFSETLYKWYEELKGDLDSEMNNWTDYSHEVEEFEKKADDLLNKNAKHLLLDMFGVKYISSVGLSAIIQ